jgi:hypothetical protein
MGNRSALKRRLFSNALYCPRTDKSWFQVGVSLLASAIFLIPSATA